MVLLASTHDQSRFLKTQDLAAEKKFKIKSVTEEEVGVGKDKEERFVVHSVMPATAGPEKLLLCSRL
jgi:hypothetical protein